MQYHAVVLQTAVHLAQVDVLGREGLTAVHQHHVVGTGRGGILLVGPDVHIARIVTPLVPFLVGVAQVAAFTAGKEVQHALARDLRAEVAVAGHQHVDGVALSEGEGRGVRLGAVACIITADVDGPLLAISLRQRHQNQ